MTTEGQHHMATTTATRNSYWAIETRPTASVINLDEGRARALLTANTNNRRLNPARVQQLADDILAGRYHLTTDGIGIDTAGRMTNGQHRCHAVIECARRGHPVTVPSVYVTGLPVESYDVTDQGQTRSAAQILSTHGLSHTKNLAAAASLVLRYQNGGFPANPPTPSKAQIQAHVLEHVETWADANRMVGAASSIVNKASLLAVSFVILTESAHPEMLGEFLAGVQTGAGLSADDPRLGLRRWAENNIKSLSGLAHQRARFAVVAKAWNFYVTDRPTRLIRFRIVDESVQAIL